MTVFLFANCHEAKNNEICHEMRAVSGRRLSGVFSQKNEDMPTFQSAYPHPYYILRVYYTIPCAIIALATFMKPATFAPFT